MKICKQTKKKQIGKRKKVQKQKTVKKKETEIIPKRTDA